jgi:hypothetical protein
MTIYSYKITRDYGFAPNPFFGFCSLATCKPDIRKSAEVGDWVLGFGSAKKGSKFKEKLIYAMKIDKKITFDEYWVGGEYQCKKPVMNGSLKQNYGDNIYHRKGAVWKQADSHHSLAGGVVNETNRDRDTSTDAVLLSTHFWYFGKDAIAVPIRLHPLIPQIRNYFRPDFSEKQLEKWLINLPERGFIGEPEKFSKRFKRYDGKS